MLEPTWQLESGEAFNARVDRWRKAHRAWQTRRAERPTDWGGLFILLGALCLPLALVLPYAFIGSGVTPANVVAGMIGTALAGAALIVVGIPLHAHWEACDPEPLLQDA